MLALLVLFPFARAAGAAEDRVTVTPCGNRVTVRAQAARLKDVLSRLGNATEISVYLKGAGDRRVTAELERVRIEEAVRELLKPYSSAVVFRRTPGARLSRIEVYIFASALGRVVESASPAAQPATEALPAEAPEGERHFAAEARKIERVADLLRDGKRLPRPFLADSDPSVRITALQWSTGKTNLVEALSNALADNDDLVQATARQMLLDRGAREDFIDALAALVRSGGKAEARQQLMHLGMNW
jgi:hypothetical protein